MQHKPVTFNRLNTARLAGVFARKMYESARQANEAGKAVAWSMVNWWEGEAILKAMDVVPVYPENYGAACAARQKAEAFLDCSTVEGFPATLCGYARNCLGYSRRMMEWGGIPPDAPLGGMAKPALLIACGTGCDARYKWFQSLGRYLEVPVWLLELPHPAIPEHSLEGVEEYGVQYIIAELKEFVAFLEKRLGRKIDWDRLSALVDTMLQTLRVWYQVDELRKAVPSPMDSRDFYSCMIPGFYLSTERDSLEFYQKLYEEVKYRVENRIGVLPEERYRLVFGELPPWHNLEFFDYLGKYGGVLVVESRGYHPPPPLESLKTISDPLERIARNVYHWRHYRFKRARRMGQMLDRTQTYLDWAEEYHCDGAILHPLLSCRVATITLTHTCNALLEYLKIPSLIIPGDIVDLRVFDEAGAKRQVDAFVEIMDHYKRIRGG